MSVITQPELTGRFVGKTVIVTGGGSGIGAATVTRFLDEGANVVSVDRDGAAAAEVVSGFGDRAVVHTVDVTDASAIEGVVTQTVDRFGSLDCYYNNAGAATRPAWIEDTADDVWEHAVAVNLTAFFIASRIVVPIMKRQRSGVLLVSGSMSGIRPRPKLSAYCATKAAAIMLAKELALEVAEYGVRVNAVCPVATDTPMFAQMDGPKLTSPAAIPMGRLARAEEMAAAALFLASDDASFITGTALCVDGGRGI